MIKRLSNQELNANLKQLVVSERKILHLILEHINEVDTRKLYLEMAYSSLYEYLVKECKYSGSAAMRRIGAARFVREIPSTSQKIESGEINLSQLNELNRAVKEKEQSSSPVSASQKMEMIEKIAGKSTAETQKQISQILDIEIKIPEKKFTQKDASVRLEITLSQEQYQQLEQCRDLAAAALFKEKNQISVADVIEHLSKIYLQKRGRTSMYIDEKGREEANRKKLFAANVDKSKNEGDLTKYGPPPEEIVLSAAETSLVAAKTRKEVFYRDKCCQFRNSKTGKICGSTFGLEIDHKQTSMGVGLACGR